MEDALVRESLPLVGYLVNEALSKLPSHVRREDLSAAGMAALAVAARSYEPERGVPFGRFASLRVRGAIVDELRSQDWASRSVRAKARARDRMNESLTATLGRTPTKGELADSLGISVASLESDVDDVHRSLVLSLSGGPTEGGADENMLDSLLPAEMRTPESEILERERLSYLRDAVECLPERLRAVIVGYFLEDRPMAEIAAELGVTESRISQMRAEAVTLLRGSLTSVLEPDLAPRNDNPQGLVSRRRESYYGAVAARSDYRTRVSAGAFQAGIPAAQGIGRAQSA
jgi:RNA polymerase sigma factor for flagellar operon FliA